MTRSEEGSNTDASAKNRLVIANWEMIAETLQAKLHPTRRPDALIDAAIGSAKVA